ncbi:MAG: CRTAC1 family protein [Actinomycetota bacterium]
MPALARPSPRFDDVPRSVGLPTEAQRSWGSILLDYDRDGLADLFLNHHERRPFLGHNEDGRFTNVWGGTLQKRWMDRHGCAWGEANGDGRPDLYCTQGASRGLGTGPNQLLLQTSTGLVNRAFRYGVRDAFGRGRTINWMDFDSDGDLDMFVGNTYREGHPNLTFKNVGRRFSRVNIGLSRELRTISSSWSDWDNDGDPDLLVLQYGTHPAVAFANRGGRFSPVRLPLVSGRPWISGAWGDFNADGRTDLQVVNERHSLILRNTGRTFRAVHRTRLNQGQTSEWIDVDNDGDLDSFVVQGASSSPKGPRNHSDFLLINKGRHFAKRAIASARGPHGGSGDAISAGDFDRDGRVDLHVTNGHGPEGWTGPGQLLRNVSPGGTWIGVHLEGSDSNPLGMGARLVVRAGSRRLKREVTDGFHHRTQSEVGYVHFGLGNHERARVRIEWPDGKSDCTVVNAGSIAQVARGSSPCRQGRPHSP